MWDGTLLAWKFLGGDVDKKTGNPLYHLATQSASNVIHLYIIQNVHYVILSHVLYIHGVCCSDLRGQRYAAGLCV